MCSDTMHVLMISNALLHQAAAAETKKAEEAAKAETEETGSKLKDTVNDAVDKVFDTFSFLEPVRPVVRAARVFRDAVAAQPCSPAEQPIADRFQPPECH